jgi:hypothetical protein
MKLAELMREAAEDQIIEAGRSLGLTARDLGYVLARNARAPWIFDMVAFHGGDARELCRQMLEARPPRAGCRPL